MRTAKHTRKYKIPRGLDPAIVENILWFSRFTPFEKIKIYEKCFERVRKLKSVALKRGGYSEDFEEKEFNKLIEKLKKESCNKILHSKS